VRFSLASFKQHTPPGFEWLTGEQKVTGSVERQELTAAYEGGEKDGMDQVERASHGLLLAVPENANA
jgi:hypothetical protein